MIETLSVKALMSAWPVLMLTAAAVLIVVWTPGRAGGQPRRWRELTMGTTSSRAVPPGWHVEKDVVTGIWTVVDPRRGPPRPRDRGGRREAGARTGGAVGAGG